MAAVAVLCLVTFLAMAGHSSAAYCTCKDGLSDSVLQKDIDYACANGADCSKILQSGSCYNPATVKDHCNYAVNSYYQRKNQASGSCDFSGSATITQTVSNQTSGCVYPSSPSTAGNSSTTPTISPSTSPGTPTTGTTPSTTTPSVFGLSPTTASGGTTTIDSKATVTTLHQKTLLFWSLNLTLLLSVPLFLRV